MICSPQLRAAMHVATLFLAPEAVVTEDADWFNVYNPAATLQYCRIPYRSLHDALDKGPQAFVDQLKKAYRIAGWL